MKYRRRFTPGAGRGLSADDAALLHIKEFAGVRFDPAVVAMFEEIMKVVVHIQRDRELVPFQYLKPDMVAAEDVYAANGHRLLIKGIRLSQVQIIKLKNYNDTVSPISQEIYVYTKK